MTFQSFSRRLMVVETLLDVTINDTRIYNQNLDWAYMDVTKRSVRETPVKMYKFFETDMQCFCRWRVIEINISTFMSIILQLFPTFLYSTFHKGKANKRLKIAIYFLNYSLLFSRFPDQALKRLMYWIFKDWRLYHRPYKALEAGYPNFL